MEQRKLIWYAMYLPGQARPSLGWKEALSDVPETGEHHLGPSMEGVCWFLTLLGASRM